MKYSTFSHHSNEWNNWVIPLSIDRNVMSILACIHDEEETWWHPETRTHSCVFLMDSFLVHENASFCWNI